MTGRGHSSAVCRFRCAALLGLCFAAALGGSARAGDILRGGAAAGSRPAVAPASSVRDAAAEQARANASDALARTTQAVQAVRAMQDAARSAAALRNGLGVNPQTGRSLPSVPDGLKPGGLQVATGVPKVLGSPSPAEDASLWQNARLPVESKAGARTIVTVEQLKAQALLTWETFNIGKQTTLRFNQSRGGSSKGSWIAVNKVLDPSGSPSQILGAIEAPGQVYVINRNGIIFGGSSQVNVGSLVASTLPLNDYLVTRGLLNNPDTQFLFSALPLAAGAKGSPAFNPTITDRPFAVDAGAPAYTLAEQVAVDGNNAPVRAPEFSFRAAGGAKTTLVATTDYTLSVAAGTRKATVTFTAAGLAKIGSAKVTATYTPVVVKSGDVTVQAGAQLASAVSAEGNGGRIMLVGSNVTNAGTISTPAGQTILAAGLQVGIEAHRSSDPTLRGLDVFVGRVAVPAVAGVPTPQAGGGTATNSGLIDIPRGNATITGRTVNQFGAIDSSTTVALNGRIDLNASYDAVSNTGYNAAVEATGTPFLFNSTGQVELGAGSVMRILPDTSDTQKAVGLELALRSQVNITGRTIHLGSGSELLAPNANVSLRAGRWIYQPSLSPPISTFVASGGQVYFDTGAMISVAGSTDGIAPVTENILTLQLRGGELAPAPVQRDGLIRGQDITIDLRLRGVYDDRYWIGTPLGNANGYAGLVERTVSELTAAGGSVTITAGGSVVMQPGSKIDVSGGLVHYEGGMVRTTRLLSGGVLYDMADATPDLIYDGIYTGTSTFTSAKWGLTQTFSQPLAPTGEHFEPAYDHGMDAGSIRIAAPALALDGTLLGQTAPGLRQVRDTPSTSALPQGGSLTINLQAQDTVTPFFTTYPQSIQVVFQDRGGQAPAAAFSLDANGDAPELDEQRRGLVTLSPDLLGKNGFATLIVTNEDGRISVPRGVNVTAPAGGKLSLTAANIDVAGNVTAPGGELSFTALNISPYRRNQISLDPTATTPPAVPGRGIFTLESGATISAAGTLVDDRPGASERDLIGLATAGGTISIAAFTANLLPGSTLDVSGGAIITGLGERVYGNGGQLTIKAGNDPNVSSLLGGTLQLGSTLRGASGARGGSLTIQAPIIQVGGQASRPETLLLAPEFFSTGGFGSFTLTGIGVSPSADGPDVPEVSIAPGTVIEPVAEKLLLLPNASSSDGRLAFQSIIDEPGRRTPVSLQFNAPGVIDQFAGGLVSRGDVFMGEGSVIRTDPLAAVTLNGQTVAVLGSIYAPAGAITISGSKNSITTFNDLTRALTTTYIGPHSVLSAAGTVLYTPDAFGRRRGEVLPGGSISISGNLVAAAGAVFDVSGTSAIFDLAPPLASPLENVSIPLDSGLTASLASLRTVPVQEDSDGGTIVLSGGQMLFTDATLIGRAGGPTALGGVLEISSGRFYPQGATASPLDVTLQVKQGGRTVLHGLPSDGAAIGQPVQNRNGTVAQGQGYVAVSSFAGGGFDSLTLGGVVDFRGPIQIAMPGELSVASGGVLYADSRVHLSAPYVQLGIPFPTPQRPEDITAPFLNGPQPLFVPPTFGTGRLVVDAALIDVGTLTLQKIGNVELNAIGGDIRGSGIFDLAGHLTLRAAQVYPVSASEFRITAYDYTQGEATRRGSVSIFGAGVSQFPLSAGGTLSIYASTINQSGTLLAPQGTINLGWDGTGTAPTDLLTGTALPFPVTQRLTLGAGSYTSVSLIDRATGEEMLVPYGVSPDGNVWIDPRGVDITASGLPAKSVNLSAQNLTTSSRSLIDLRGGGDLYAYRWVDGNTGNVDVLGQTEDIWSPTTEYQAGQLVRFGGKTWSARVRHTGETPAASTYWQAVPESYAVLPDYASQFTPYARFNNSALATNLIGDSGPGYFDSSLRPGDRIYLNGSSALAAGTYTLLPARYALLPGAVLVRPRSGTPLGTIGLTDSSTLVAGYRFNGLDAGHAVSQVASWFEVASEEVLRNRARYDDFTANLFLSYAAADLGIDVQRLPADSGRLLLQATQSMSLLGKVASPSVSGGHGSWIDITTGTDPASPVNILLNGTGTGSTAGTIALSIPGLNAFGAESLLIGGRRTTSETGTTVTAQSGTVTVARSGTALSAPDVILASTTGITIDPGARVVATGSVSEPVDLLQLTGGGSLLRLSVDRSARIERAITSTTSATLDIGAGALLSGRSLILDTTGNTTLDPTAVLDADYVSLNSGRISIQLDNPGALQPGAGLVLAGEPLENLQSGKSLKLLSYSSLDFYGTGEFGRGLGRLSLSAGEIRGFNQGSGEVRIVTGTLDLGNPGNVTAPGSVAAPEGTFAVDAQTIRLQAGNISIDQYATVELNAGEKIIGYGSGTLSVQAALDARTRLLTGAAGSNRAIVAGGALSFTPPADSTAGGVAGGFGATIALTGTAVTLDSAVLLPSGSLTVRATTGGLLVGGILDVSGTRRDFYDLTRFLSAGEITLLADAGDITLGPESVIDVAADAGGGNAGTLTISAANGEFTSTGTLSGAGGAGGRDGSFALTTRSLASTAALTASLTAANLTDTQTIRVRTGNVSIDSTIHARDFQLSADAGSITVESGVTIDASGHTGGSIALIANGDVTLLGGSTLTVAAEDFSAAGKGGEVHLEAGSQTNGVLGSGRVSIQAGSRIDLSVASKVAGDAVTLGSSAYEGKFSGKLTIRAPQTAAFNDVQVDAIDGTIVDASSIIVEGYRLYDLASTGGVITTAVQTQVQSNGVTFLGAAGTTTAGYTAMVNRLLASNAALEPQFVIVHGAELFNSVGDITLGTTSSTATSDWNLGTVRFGAKSAPGVLTLRASGNLVFYNALSDGFLTSAYDARLLVQNTSLPVNTQSWSYRLTAGADLSAAASGEVRTTNQLTATAGFLKLGKNNGTNSSNSNTNGVGNTPGTSATTSAAVANRFQVIRTGSGDITINAGRGVQLLNQFATIYTAGTQVTNGTLDGDFNTPSANQTGGETTFGANQQPTPYPARFTMAGGNVVIRAGTDIEHLTVLTTGGPLVADSGRELPNNWLYRRGYIDPVTGAYGIGRFNDITTTAWWIDFSNFFQGIGALGGGDVTLIAGGSVRNVDAVVPTNARQPISTGSKLLELGGGNLIVRAGADIDGGVYYVERGHGELTAGRDITTNATRTLSVARLDISAPVLDSRSWLPTTLFLGKGGFDVTARGNLLLGPVGNPFLLPVGINNSYWNKTYFSTYALDSYVNVTAIGGDLTLRESAMVGGTLLPLLQAWTQRMQLLTSAPRSASFYQPWLRLAETTVAPFATTTALLPGTLRATSISGDINLVGNLTLSPSPTGTLDLLASGAINGLQPAGTEGDNGGRVIWAASTINVSDTDPALLPSPGNPFGYQQFVGAGGAGAANTEPLFLESINVRFRESGSVTGDYAVVQTKQALHGSGVLHEDDDEPIRLYAGAGDIAGLTLFAPKETQVFAGQDIQDVSLYIQNIHEDDTSIVSSGRDIIPFRANAPLRTAANATGNSPALSAGPRAGDIQIGGPGTLEVLAGCDLDLGTGTNNADGTGVGITSIGNGRNPNLQFRGAELVVGAGIGPSSGLGNSALALDEFIQEYVEGSDYLADIEKNELGGRTFEELTEEERHRVALQVFYRILRDTGRDFPETGNYDEGLAAIETLFGNAKVKGNLLTRGRDIRTKNGGSISILAPGGSLLLADTTIGNPLTPPGIVTESGGDISIFTRDDVNIGIGRIFTLRGGNQIIWSSEGDIAAGSAPKTVQSAPPTRVLIDPQTATVQTDLAGLATGGGIGVLATVSGIEPGDVDLIAPKGTVDAGDAGIRATGNLSIAAVTVLNADNIQVAGTTTGAPSAPAVAAPNFTGLASASNAASAATNAASEAAAPPRPQGQTEEDVPSIIVVEVGDYDPGDTEQ